MRAALVLGLVASPLVAFAQPRATKPRPTKPRPTKIDVQPLVPRDARLVPHEPTSRLIYIKRCPDTGCLIRPGAIDDARADTSQIVTAQSTIGGFRQGDAVWNAMLDCVRATYAPFNVGITDVDPGNVPHYMNVVGGHPSDAGFGPGVGGVAPFTCTEIPNSVSFTFSDVLGSDAEVLCYVVAQETAHAFGLEHEMDNRDPLTYLSGPFPKRFQAADAPCGEFEQVACDCGGATQNSYEHLLAVFGPGVPTPPTVEVISPASGKRVQPRFVVRVEAEDDVAVDKIVMTVDGVFAAETKELPYKLVAPDGIAEGPHVVEIIALDVQGTPASVTLDLEMGPPCTAATGCEGDDVCVMGVCLAGPGAPGGLGAFCQANTECVSNTCTQDTSGARHCTEACDLSPGSCPAEFTCIAAGAAGVCWPVESGGCCDAGGSGGLPAALFGLGALAIVLRRRR